MIWHLKRENRNKKFLGHTLEGGGQAASWDRSYAHQWKGLNEDRCQNEYDLNSWSFEAVVNVFPIWTFFPIAFSPIAPVLVGL